MDELAPPNDEEKALAALCHASAVLGFGGWLPLFIYLVKREQSPFVAFHAGQSMVFHLGISVVVIVVALLTCGLGAILLLPWMLFEAWLAWEAFQGNWIGYPGMENMFRDRAR